MAGSTDPVQSPTDREKAISAAYLRYLGATQQAAAKSVGIGDRTLRRWEDCSWWPEVQAIAADRWLSGLAANARNGLSAGVLADGNLALKVLERLDDRLSPPKLRAELTGANGGPIQHEDVSDMTDEELTQRARELHNRVAYAFGAVNGNGEHPNGNGNGAHG